MNDVVVRSWWVLAQKDRSPFGRQGGVSDECSGHGAGKCIFICTLCLGPDENLMVAMEMPQWCLGATAKMFTWGQTRGLDCHHHGSLVGWTRHMPSWGLGFLSVKSQWCLWGYCGTWNKMVPAPENWVKHDFTLLFSSPLSPLFMETKRLMFSSRSDVLEWILSLHHPK